MQRPAAAQFSLDKAESDEEEQEQQLQSSPGRALAAAAAEPRDKRGASRQQLLERTRLGVRRSSLQQQLVDSGREELVPAQGAAPVRRGSVDAFAVEIESEAAEIRTLIARTAQLWSAVDLAERADDPSPVAQPVQLQTSRRLSASAILTSRSPLPRQYECADDDSTLSGEEEDYEGEDGDDTESESVSDVTLLSVTRPGGYPSDETFVEPVRHNNSTGAFYSDRNEQQNRVHGGDGAIYEYDCDSEGSEEDIEAMNHENGELQLEQGELIDASNRAINASKARAIRSAMLGNLIRLGFRENITIAALEAGVLEIDHYDSDCELAYVDIFMSLIKMKRLKMKRKATISRLLNRIQPLVATCFPEFQ
ncbi:ring zinc finger-containing protein [Phytophthora cinnamomi]|uniref:ring zinc finger-containing protein n=1 Tax=Phytophthora cinnamomi TaxID=4785 RepID=UPI003559F043|nr:ring zinc finger-containing protein [Phytophthora cinnamomi]